MEVQIVCRGMECTTGITAAVREQADDLEKMQHKFSRCEVMIGSARRHHGREKALYVRVVVKMPHETIVVSREPEQSPSPETLQAALRDAFQAVKKRLDAGALAKREEKRRDKAAQKHLVKAS